MLTSFNPMTQTSEIQSSFYRTEDFWSHKNWQKSASHLTTDEVFLVFLFLPEYICSSTEKVLLLLVAVGAHSSVDDVEQRLH